MRKGILIVSALLLCSCATYQKKMEGWKGKSIDQAITKYGAPTRTADMSDGKKAYTWEHGGYYHCSDTFITDKSGIIINASWFGPRDDITGEPQGCF